MARADIYRRLVVARAGGACEYCRLLELGTGVTFHVEHIRPRSQGGKTVMDNLALSCPGCNLAKAGKTTGADGEPLFNPREYQPWLLGWHLHFLLDRNSGLILPRTATGETTIATLLMNGPQRAFARRLQIQAGLIA